MKSSYYAEQEVESERKSKCGAWRTSPRAYKYVPTHQALPMISRQRPAVHEHSLKTQDRVSVAIFRAYPVTVLLERVLQCSVVKTGGSQLQNWGGLAGPWSDDNRGSNADFISLVPQPSRWVPTNTLASCTRRSSRTSSVSSSVSGALQVMYGRILGGRLTDLDPMI